MLLFVGKDIFVDFLDFLFEVVNFSPDHGELLLDAVLIVSIDEFLILLADVLERGEIADHGILLLKF